VKFQQLAVGARFEFQGKVHVKTGPLTATAEQGGQVLIPRYAVLKPLDLPAPEAPGAALRRLDAGRVRQAFEAFYSVARENADPAAETALAAARVAFFEALK
jgi:hypothetical protein